jgi:hypothetical protein
VLTPLRGIAVDSVESYIDDNDTPLNPADDTVHLIIRLDPTYKGGKFNAAYGESSGPSATDLQIWIGKVAVTDNNNEKRILGSATVMDTNGIEDFFALFGSVSTGL